CDQVPVMVVARKVIGLEHQCVAVDNREAAREAVEHLISFGHRRIATITGLGDHPDAVYRLAGYHDALRDAGIEIDNGLVCGGDFSAQSGVLAINSLLMRGIHFSAVFCANDATAIGAQLALYRHGIRVPNDISLVGFDDQGEAAFLTPPLTTVRQPAVEMGQAAATALIRLMQEEPASVPPMKACLIARETVSRISR
ncbi:MAG: substrate-binding domain-containing protein, partial [Planctomycetota bacterium]